MRLASLALLLVLTAVAHAGPPGLTPPLAPEPEPAPMTAPMTADHTEAYRAQTLGADAAAVGLVLLAAATDGSGRHSNTTSVLELAAATYVIGGPLIHLLHDRPGRAAGSLALRVGAPFVLALLGGYLATAGQNCSGYDACDSDSANIAGAMLGGLVGAITASVIDAAVFAKGDPSPLAPHLTATAVRGGGMTFGVAASF